MVSLPRAYTRTTMLLSPVLAFFALAPALRFYEGGNPAIVLAFLLLVCFIAVAWQLNYTLYRQKYKTWITWAISFCSLAAVFAIGFKLVPEWLLPPHLFHADLVPWPGMVGVNAIVLIIVHGQFAAAEKEQVRREMEQLKRASLEAQKQALIQQLNPHFLFNALSVLKALIDEDATTAKRYVVKLSEFLRHSADNANSELVALATETRFTRDYIEIQQLRFGNGLQVTWCVDEKPGGKVPGFALQTLVENAIKHNWFTESKPLCITIASNGSNIVVRNNKSLRPKATGGGIGLRNLQERYRLLTNKAFTITENDNEFVVTLPLIDA